MQLTTNATRVMNLWFGISTNDLTTNVVVVTDSLYNRLASSTSLTEHWQISSYVLPNWQQSESIVNALRQCLPASQQTLLTDTVTNFDSGKQSLSVMLFAAFFMSCLFFLAAGSAIYFKLFTQQEEDQRQFHALERPGFQRRQAARLLNREFLLLFFLPILFALVHSVVALLDLAQLMVGMHHGNLFPTLSIAAIIMQAFVPSRIFRCRGSPSYEPGTRWLYHVASDILGALLTRITGQPLETVLRERVFEPLGMRDTGFVVPAEKRHRLAVLYGSTRAGELAVLDYPDTTGWADPPLFPQETSHEGLIGEMSLSERRTH